MARSPLPAPVLALAVCVVSALSLAACGEPQATASLAPFAKGEMADFEATENGAPPPEVALVNAEGTPEKLADLMGERATLVNLWATWCAPCILEMPALNELQDDYRDQGLNVVAINLDGDAQKGLDFYTKESLTALGFHNDPDLLAPSLFGTASLPLTVIYDSAGKEIGRTWGAPDWTSDDGRAVVEAALAMAAAE
jgi:thiol-disulfide isomerase/thioredoxin